MDAVSPEVCECWMVACRSLLDDARCPLGWCPNLLGHGRAGVDDCFEVRAEAKLVGWWLEAPFWLGCCHHRV